MDSKKSYQEKMDAELREWQAKIDVLKAKADKVEAGQKAKYQEQINALKEKKRQFEDKLDTLRSSSENAWDEVRTGVDKAWQDLKSAVSRASDSF